MGLFLSQFPRPDALEKSVFYWWIEYLKRSESYKEQCRRGRGRKVFRDFGDIFKPPFMQWWMEHDELFLSHDSEVLWHLETIEEFQEALDEKWLVIKIDPSSKKEDLMSYFEDFLDEKGLNRRGRIKHNQAVIKQAPYPVFCRPNTIALKTTLEVYDRYLKDPKPLYMIGRAMELLENQMPKEGDTAESLSDKNRVMAAAVSRYLRNAGALIENVERGIFPKNHDYDINLARKSKRAKR